MIEKLLILLITIFLMIFPLNSLAKTAWSENLRPGDKVCLYDIGKSDLLVGDDSYSLKYWYRSPRGNQQSTRQLRPSVRKLLFRLLWPGLKIVSSDKNGAWYSAKLLVIKNGYKARKASPRLIERGENTLIINRGLSFIPNWQTLTLTKTRLKKKPVLGNCYRKYKVY
jgi:hypothetical protein